MAGLGPWCTNRPGSWKAGDVTSIDIAAAVTVMEASGICTAGRTLAGCNYERAFQWSLT